MRANIGADAAVMKAAVTAAAVEQDGAGL